MPIIDADPTTLLLTAIIAYLLGSIPSGILLARLMGLGDLRQIGSGNIGATNVLRTGSKKAAALTLLFDALKGITAVLIGSQLHGAETAQLAGLFAMLGHCFPVWLRFRGGKGVATYFGVVFALSLAGGLIAAAIWLTTAALSRYSSLAALMTAGWVPLGLAFVGHGNAMFMAMILGALIYARHWSNIQRLRAGTESKIGSSSKP